jgi:hypothetical protein
MTVDINVPIGITSDAATASGSHYCGSRSGDDSRRP